MRRSTVLLVLVLISASARPARAAEPPFPAFTVQEIDKTLKVGYGLRVVDLNADGKLDVVVADAARVVWFDNAGGWKRRTILDNDNAGVKPDNVALDVADIDADGKLDVALAADWQINNTAGGGSLQWLRQGKTIDEWTVHPIAASIPTLHRIHFADIDGDGKPELLAGPIRGINSTLRENYMDKPLRLLAYAVPKEPAGEWGEPRVLDESLHHMHNFTRADLGTGAAANAILTASAEGVGALTAGPDGAWKWARVGAGHPENPKGPRGSSEVKPGYVGKQPTFIAAIEPLHGHEVVTYHFAGSAAPAAPNAPAGARLVVDDQLKGGHALWCADLDGDGADEIVAGFREPVGAAPGGVNAYRLSGAGPGARWQKHVLDDKAMACEDLACADLNADGRIDVVAAGRSTGNLRIYWNQGTQKP
jgi:hypothetical protein